MITIVAGALSHAKYAVISMVSSVLHQTVMSIRPIFSETWVWSCGLSKVGQPSACVICWWKKKSLMSSSAYTRSVKLEVPTLIPCFMDMCCNIQSMATQKRAGARMHPCLTPDDVWKHLVTVSAQHGHVHLYSDEECISCSRMSALSGMPFTL